MSAVARKRTRSGSCRYVCLVPYPALSSCSKMRVQKPPLFDQLSTKGRHSSTPCRRGKSYPGSLVLFLLPDVAVNYCASCSDFCLYLIAAIDRFGNVDQIRRSKVANGYI